MKQSRSRFAAFASLILAVFFLSCAPSGFASDAATPHPERWPYQAAPDLGPCFSGKDAALVVVHLGSGQQLELGGKRIELRLPPCSTYKIPHALIGLECGILTGPDQRFPYSGEARPIKDWERDHSLRSSMYYSVVPIYKWLAAEIGRERMRSWLNLFSYGNRDISSGQTSFWLGESLEISAIEQIAFLRNLIEGRLPVASASFAVVDEITRLERFADGEYHGKTGSSYKNGNWVLGWWVGWISRGTDRYVFAGNIRDTDNASGFAARRCIEQALKHLGLLPMTRAERLNMGYQEFDQDMKGGWRAVADGGCELEAAKLLEEYLGMHEAKLEPWQRRILRWHAGQMQAFAGETTAALRHFRKSYETRDIDKQAPLRWNAYVRATIAFLQGDLKTLRACREAMQRGPQDPQWVTPNRTIVDRFIAGLGSESYRDAYSGLSSPKP